MGFLNLVSAAVNALKLERFNQSLPVPILRIQDARLYSLCIKGTGLKKSIIRAKPDKLSRLV